jgi:hypothetical protein
MSDTNNKLTADGGPNDLHYEMMCAEGEITAALERHGFDPCPAGRVASDCTRRVWDVWGKLLTERDRAQAAVDAAERERDEARAQVHEWEESDAASSVLVPVFTEEIARITKERDEARAQLAAAQQENERQRAAAMQFWSASALVREDNGESIDAYNEAVDVLSRELNGGAGC